MLPQSNWVFQGAVCPPSTWRNPTTCASWMGLPLSHSFGKVLLSAGYQVGFVTYVDGRVPKIVENLPSIQPTIMAGVPASSRRSTRAPMPRPRKAAVPRPRSSTGRSKRRPTSKAKQRADASSPKPTAGARMALADKLVFSKIRALTGGRMKVMISGSAALSGDVARWFDAAGLPIIEVTA